MGLWLMQEQSGTVEYLQATLHHLKEWRVVAEKTLEVGDPPFSSQEELEGPFQNLSPEEDLDNAGEKGTKKKQGAGAGARKRKKAGSLFLSEAELTAAREHWNLYCQNLCCVVQHHSYHKGQVLIDASTSGTILAY
ncbi:hypothetical protein CTheo_8560 [Ceratobasidium theobromae]|uniref:Uncharacterized protein n=1 Tax=Ceratobasidium theobromae TaxID=1582974 RepID=A0A5N5Q999_9AGAM|nr:hypothetical protein CTheo_8560 [Ceratobasidium theobromae]